MKKIYKSDEEWRALLTEEQYRVTRRKGTETPFCGAFYDHKKWPVPLRLLRPGVIFFRKQV